MTVDRILTGDWVECLQSLPDGSVNCVVTSPPYWGLRDYHVAGQIGLEATPAEYVNRMVAGFEEVRRVLKGDGTLWLNMGDCYASGARWRGDASRVRDVMRGYRGDHPTNQEKLHRHRALRDGTHAGKHTAISAMGPMTQPNRMPLPGLKPKDLVGMPWRVAFPLQEAGWYLRCDIIWAKPNPMPESVTDRPTKAHEYLFLLSKSERYHYDAAAISEPTACRGERFPVGWMSGPGGHNEKVGRYRSGNKQRKSRSENGGVKGRSSPATSVPWEDSGRGRNKRSVWTIATAPFPDSRFATFPTALVVPCIMAGCPPGGVVLDPFLGSGTTAEVALRAQRHFIGIELNPEYVALALRRITPLLEQQTLQLEAVA